METVHKRPSIDQTNYVPKSETPTLKETLRNIWTTPNLPLIISTNCLEWIDMFLFIHCASLFASVFAPQELQDKMATIFAGILWIVPSLSAIILGILSDQWGRRRPLMITAFGVIILTAFLAIIPTYSQIGIWSFVIFMSIRILMSFFISGESILANVYAYESSSNYEYTCLTMPFVDAGEIVAGICILLVSSLLLSFSDCLSNEYIARVLLVSLVICFAVLIRQRQNLKESQQFLHERDMAESHEIYGRTYLKMSTLFKENIGLKREFFLYALLRLLYPIPFIISYIYVPDILKERLAYSTLETMHHNIFVLFGELFITLSMAFTAFFFENKKILSRKTLSLSVLIFPLIGGVVFFYYLTNSNHLDPLVIALCQISLLGFCCSTLMGGQFFSQFPTVGRMRLSTIAWACSRVIGAAILFGIMEPLKAYGHYDYFFVFFVALAIHFVVIYLSKEPTREQKLLGFDGRWMLQKKQLQKKLGYEI